MSTHSDRPGVHGSMRPSVEAGEFPLTGKVGAGYRRHVSVCCGMGVRVRLVPVVFWACYNPCGSQVAAFPSTRVGWLPSPTVTRTSYRIAPCKGWRQASRKSRVRVPKGTLRVPVWSPPRVPSQYRTCHGSSPHTYPPSRHTCSLERYCNDKHAPRCNPPHAPRQYRYRACGGSSPDTRLTGIPYLLPSLSVRLQPGRPRMRAPSDRLHLCNCGLTRRQPQRCQVPTPT